MPKHSGRRTNRDRAQRELRTAFAALPIDYRVQEPAFTEKMRDMRYESYLELKTEFET
jgi:hypothetical protein